MRHAHDVLRAIRRVKTTLQLNDAFESLITFLRATRQQVEAQTTKSATRGIAGPGPGAYLHVPPNPAADAQAVMSQLKQVSLLCGAFCRRVEHVLRTTYTYADVDDATHRGPTAVRVSACVAQLAEELQRFNTPAVNRLFAAAAHPSSTSPASSPVDCVLSYGVGDLCDYQLCRRKRAQAYLQQLLAQPQWNTAAVCQVIVSLNETLSSPVDTFALCTTDEAVEATCVVTPLRDPISQAVIRLPARGEQCVHLEMFDVERFLQAAQQRSFNTVDVAAPCPLCSRPVHLSTLRVDTRALEAMRAYDKAAASPAADLPPLTADCALEWNTESRTVTVVRGKRGALTEAGGTIADDHAEETPPSLRPRDDTPETSTKKRRIEIGGHVLYAD